MGTTYTSDSAGNVFEVRVVPAGTPMPDGWEKRYSYQDWCYRPVEAWYREVTTKIAPIRLHDWRNDTAANQQDAS